MGAAQMVVIGKNVETALHGGRQAATGAAQDATVQVKQGRPQKALLEADALLVPSPRAATGDVTAGEESAHDPTAIVVLTVPEDALRACPAAAKRSSTCPSSRATTARSRSAAIGGAQPTAKTPTIDAARVTASARFLPLRRPHLGPRAAAAPAAPAGGDLYV